MTDPKPVEESEELQVIRRTPAEREKYFYNKIKNDDMSINNFRLFLAWERSKEYSRGRRDVVFESDPKVMGGELCVRGTRVPVSLVQETLVKGITDEWGWWGWQEPLKEIVLEALKGLEDGE